MVPFNVCVHVCVNAPCSGPLKIPLNVMFHVPSNIAFRFVLLVFHVYVPCNVHV